jgi:aspartate aminotransferase-like enzyme
MVDPDEKLLMTPGPTALPGDVRGAMDQPIHNPDVEPGFVDVYRSLLEKLARVYGTDDDVLILGGEGMLGLDASVASLVEPDEDVLCLANGVFGEGFADLVETNGGRPVTHSVPADTGFEVEGVKSLVEANDVVAATVVHCETPTGLRNDLEEVLRVLQDAGVLTVVDAVSSLGGTEAPPDCIDVCLGASQKCFSSPPGLTTLSVSERAWEKIESTEQRGFYTSLAPWRDIDLETDDAVLLPYTHLVSNLYALEASLDLILEEGIAAVHERHATVARRCRERGRELGLETYPSSAALCSPTVTAFRTPGRAPELQQRLAEQHDVVVATSLGTFADDIVRVGHMGYNAQMERVDRTMDALGAVLE